MNTAYRFKFSKGDGVKFIGHLDVMKVFQRAMKRAGLPIAYSQGFNPHQLLAFAAPLPLGYTSDGEYGDFRLTEEVSANEVVEKLNAALPRDMAVTKVITLKEGAKNTMASLCAAEYMACFNGLVSDMDIEREIENFLKKDEIFVMKKTKKGIKETDIKPDIIKLWKIEGGIGMVVSAGSIRNIKPESVAEGFSSHIEKEFDKYKMTFKRVDMFMNDGNALVPLMKGVER
ncbi:MAG: DUF2344 domain-containing protein [Firmicutes bacterium]|nr:DUF2344 domain-containing protein [Bacillota bacterium]